MGTILAKISIEIHGLLLPFFALKIPKMVQFRKSYSATRFEPESAAAAGANHLC